MAELLQGQSGLLFAYGVSGSGKTYTIQGEEDEGEDGNGNGEGRGLVPRSIDVVFNSIQGLGCQRHVSEKLLMASCV